MGISFCEYKWRRFVCSALTATFLVTTVTKADPNEWNSTWSQMPSVWKGLNSFRCKSILGGLALGSGSIAAGFLYFDGTHESEGETFQGLAVPARPVDANLPLFSDSSALSTFRFSEEGTAPPTVAFFYGPDQKAIAKNINRQALIDETNPGFRRRLEQLQQSPPYLNEALYVEFEGVLFERLREDSERAQVYLSLSTREVLLLNGTLEEIKPPLLRIRANNGSQEDQNEMRRRQSISISDLENGEEITFSWLPPAERSGLGTGQAEATAKIRYEKSTGKIYVSRASTRLEVRSFFIRGGVTSGSASLENLEATRSFLPRKPIF